LTYFPDHGTISCFREQRHFFWQFFLPVVSKAEEIDAIAGKGCWKEKKLNQQIVMSSTTLRL
jgi:hypothetical protein